MSLSKKLAAIRKKPRRVRERYLLVAMAIVAPVLFIVWFVTFHYDASTSGTGFFKSIGDNVSSSFTSPVYKSTFGDTSFGGGTEQAPQTPAPEPAAPVPTVPTPSVTASGPI